MALSANERKRLRIKRRKGLMAGEREFAVRVNEASLLLGTAIQRKDSNPGRLVRMMRIARARQRVRQRRNGINEEFTSS